MTNNKMKVVYNANGEKVIIGEILTNHNMTVEEALNILDIDMDTWYQEQGWDGYDYNDIELEY